MNRCVSLMAALECCVAVLCFSGCGGGGYSNTQTMLPPPLITVSISPTFGAIDQGQSVTLTAATNDPAGKGVSWSLSGPGTLTGTTSSSTTYTAPSTGANPVGVTLTATSITNAADSFPFGFNVTPPPMIVTSPGMPDGNVGTAYAQNIPTTGGTGNFTFVLTGGTLPPSLTMSPNGLISGTPTFPVQNYNIKVMLTDASPGGNVTTSGNLSINIGPPLPLVITPSTPPIGTVGFRYNSPFGFFISATGGTQPYNFSLATGSSALPAGLGPLATIGNQGVISGTPTVAGTISNIMVQVTDSQAPPVISPAVTYSITINPSTSFIGTTAPGDIWQIFVVHNPVATTGMFQKNDQGTDGLPGTAGFARTESFSTTPAGFRQYVTEEICTPFPFNRCRPVVFGDTVEMQGEMALMQPTDMGSKVIAAVANSCPQLSTPTTYQFVALPSSSFTITDAAYGNVAVTQTNTTPNTYTVTSSTFQLDGTSITPNTFHNVLCDATFQVLTIPGASPTTMAFSGHGAMVIDNGTGIPSVGLQQPAIPLPTTGMNGILAGQYLGVLFHPNLPPGTRLHPAPVSQVVGFGPNNTGATLTGGVFVNPGGDQFSAHPTNEVITLGTQTSPGLFPGGTLVIGTNPVIKNFDVVAGQVNGKFVLYGIGLDTSNSSSPQPTAVLLIQQ